jgi:hypothetical protein
MHQISLIKPSQQRRLEAILILPLLDRTTFDLTLKDYNCRHRRAGLSMYLERQTNKEKTPSTR